MKLAVLFVGLALLVEIATSVQLLQRVDHMQRCLAIVQTATDSHTPAAMRDTIMAEFDREGCP